MNSELLTQWSAYSEAVGQILQFAQREIRIFDGDLSRLGLEKKENADCLRRFLAATPHNMPRIALRIVLRNAEPFRRNSPRLFSLLADFPHIFEVWESRPPSTSLTDSLFLVDDHHALIRIHEDHARSRLILDDATACRSYRLRFEEIMRESGTPISATTLGL